MKTKLIACFCLSLSMLACSTTPSNIIVSPDIMGLSSKINYANKLINLSVQDLRNSAHVVQILQKDKAAVLVNSQSELNEIIQTTLSRQFAMQGLMMNDGASNQFDVSIVKALITVNQTIFKYDTETEITLSVQLANGENTLTKNYRRTGKSNGPLSPDLAVLGRDFNQQLTKALNQIVNDPEIQALVK